MMAERPTAIDQCTTVGHWDVDVDTVVGTGAPDCVATLVERKTGFAMLGQLRNRSSRGMTRRLRRLIRRAPRKFTTMTADNGTEFHDYRTVERTTGLRFYFATPYHSWERGSNENLNGRLRQYLPEAHELGRADATPLRRAGSTAPLTPTEAAGLSHPRGVLQCQLINVAVHT